MGKGKGTRKGMRAFVSAGTFLFKVTSMRRGTMFFFLKKLQARVPFKLGVDSQKESLGFYGYPYT
jgi:ribosomal protein L16/L10AE